MYLWIVYIVKILKIQTPENLEEQSDLGFLEQSDLGFLEQSDLGLHGLPRPVCPKT